MSISFYKIPRVEGDKPLCTHPRPRYAATEIPRPKYATTENTEIMKITQLQNTEFGSCIFFNYVILDCKFAGLCTLHSGQ